MASSLALVVFAAATLFFGWCRPEFRTAAPEPFSIQQNQALVILTILLVPLIVYSMHAMLSGSFAVENRGGTYVISSGSGYALEAQHMAGPLICAWLALTRFRWQALLVLVPYVLVRTYAGTSRWSIVLVMVAVGLVYAWQKRFTRPPVWAMVGVVPLLPAVSRDWREPAVPVGPYQRGRVAGIGRGAGRGRAGKSEGEI